MEYHLTEAFMQGLLMQNCRVIVYIDDITRIHIPQDVTVPTALTALDNLPS